MSFITPGGLPAHLKGTHVLACAANVISALTGAEILIFNYYIQFRCHYDHLAVINADLQTLVGAQAPYIHVFIHQRKKLFVHVRSAPPPFFFLSM